MFDRNDDADATLWDATTDAVFDAALNDTDLGDADLRGTVLAATLALFA